MTGRCRHLLTMLAFLAVGAFGLPLHAQTYPSGMIRVVGATAPGNPPDIIARLIANELAESEGWRIVVENKPCLLYTSPSPRD